MSGQYFDERLHQKEIAKNILTNFIQIVNNDDIITFWENEKNQINYLTDLLSIDEDAEFNRENISEAIELLYLRREAISIICEKLEVKNKTELIGIEETKKRIETYDPIVKWKERKQITKHDWAIRVTDLAFSEINNLTFICELAGSFLNDAILLTENQKAVEKMEYAKRELYKLLRYFEMQKTETDDFLNDELNSPDGPF